MENSRRTSVKEEIERLKTTDPQAYREYMQVKERQRLKKERAAEETRKQEAVEEKERLAREALERARKEEERKQGELRTRCRRLVKGSSKFPTKVDFHTLRYGRTSHLADGTFMYSGRVDLMNSFGAMIPHTFSCQFLRGKLTGISITPG